MKLVLIVISALALVNLSTSQDDGRYRPSQYEQATQYPPIYFRSFSVQPQDLHKLKLPILDYGKSRSEPVVSASAFSPVFIKPVSHYTTPKPIAIDSYYRPYYAKSYNTNRNAKIYGQVADVDANGYNYYYQTENGISAQETGRVDSPYGGTKATGFYEYIGDDGIKYRVDYVADENGFQPRGAHIPH